jgi:hypothetical protein
VVRARLNKFCYGWWVLSTSSNRVANFLRFFYIRSWTQYLRFTTTLLHTKPLALDLPDILLGLELLLRWGVAIFTYNLWVDQTWTSKLHFPIHTKLTWTNKLWNTNTPKTMVSWCQTTVEHVSNANTCD